MRILLALFATFISVASIKAYADDTIVNIPLADVLAMPEAKTKLSGSIKFYLIGQPLPPKTKKMNEVITNKKTNAFNKSDIVACRWVALSALIALEEEARNADANAVVDIVSYFKKSTVKSDKTIECHAGTLMAGVALKGVFAKLP